MKAEEEEEGAGLPAWLSLRLPSSVSGEAARRSAESDTGGGGVVFTELGERKVCVVRKVSFSGKCMEWQDGVGWEMHGVAGWCRVGNAWCGRVGNAWFSSSARETLGLLTNANNMIRSTSQTTNLGLL